MGDEGDDWEAVAELVREHLASEHLSLAAFARRSGVSDATLRPLLKELRPIRRADVRRKLNDAHLGRGGLEAVLAGRAPIEGRLVQVDGAALDAAIDELMSAAANLRRVVASARPVDTDGP